MCAASHCWCLISRCVRVDVYDPSFCLFFCAFPIHFAMLSTMCSLMRPQAETWWSSNKAAKLDALEACLSFSSQLQIFQTKYLLVLDYADAICMHAATNTLKPLDATYCSCLRVLTFDCFSSILYKKVGSSPLKRRILAFLAFPVLFCNVWFLFIANFYFLWKYSIPNCFP